MTTDHRDALPPDEAVPVPLAELADLSGLSEAEVLELVEYGALAPSGEAAGHFVFAVRSITVARDARRLRETFELETRGVALMLACLDRIRDLESQVRALQARLPR